jgi:hypothetical protein
MKEQVERPSLSVNTEVEAMRSIGEALDGLGTAEARNRVLSWAMARFRVQASENSAEVLPAEVSPPAAAPSEIPGIARLNRSGGLEITIRDLKAKSTVDAAMRLAHIVLYANEKLKGNASVSSRGVLVPILRQWRAYDGNTRSQLAQHKGIRRDGDMLSLDAIARRDAETYMKEILDPSTRGTWNTGAKRPRRPGAGTREGER